MTDNIIIIKDIPSYYLNNIIINQFKDIGNINNYIIFLLSNLKQKIIFIEYSQSLEADIGKLIIIIIIISLSLIIYLLYLQSKIIISNLIFYFSSLFILLLFILYIIIIYIIYLFL